MERSRFSGTLSIAYRINQLIRATRFWLLLAVIVGVIVTGCGVYVIGKKIETETPGAVPFVLRYELFRASLKIPLKQYSPPYWIVPIQLQIAVDQKDSQRVALLYNIIRKVEDRMKWAPIWGGIAFVITFIIGILVARRERNLQVEELYKRGAIRMPSKKLSKLLNKNLGKGVIRIGKVLIPNKLENLSFFFIGRPQQGKTQAILRMLDCVIKRGDRAIIWCAKQEDFVTTHFTDKDHIFCPGDQRSIKWSLKNDVTSLSDFEDIAARIIPENSSDSKGPWNKGAREILTGLMKYWWLKTDRTNAALWKILNSSISSIYANLSSLPDCGLAAGLLEKTESNTSHSFYVTMMVYVKPFELLAKNDGDFSINSYLKNGSGNIFILSGNRMKKFLQPVQTLFIDLFMTHHFDLKQDRSRRIWYFLDELPALNKLPKLEELLNVGPSYGASVIIGTQSFDLIDSVYEESGRRAIFNACNTATVFSVADDRTADELSRNLGKEEVNQPKQNYSIAANDGKGSTSIRQENNERLLFIPDQIKNLRSMNCIVRVLGYGVSETNLTFKEWPQHHPAFVTDERYSLVNYEMEVQSLIKRLNSMKDDGLKMSRKAKALKDVKTIQKGVEDDDDRMLDDPIF